MSKKKGKKGQCVYCGKIRSITNDHVPPKNLFAKTQRNNLITVPSCKECHSENKQVSKDDEYFRLVLTTRAGVAEHPDIDEEIFPTVIRSLTKPEAVSFRNAFLKNLRKVDLVSSGGLYVGSADGYEVNLMRGKRVLVRTIKGLFYHEKGYRLPDMYKVSVYSDEDVRELNEDKRNDLLTKIIQPLVSNTLHTVGNNVFSYIVAYTDADPNISVWGLIFYQQVYFLCMIVPNISVKQNTITMKVL